MINPFQVSTMQALKFWYVEMISSYILLDM